MDRFLRPERFDTDPSQTDSADQWNHWFRTFAYFLKSLESHNPDKLQLLINYVSPSVFKSISNCKDYDAAIVILQSLYVKPRNEIFARHLLFTCKQENGQTLEQYMQKLRILADDCNYTAVTAENHRDEAIRDSFIRGIQSGDIRQRLLERTKLSLTESFETAKSMEMAHRQSMTYQMPASNTCAAAPDSPLALPKLSENTVAAVNSKCFFCGYTRHPRISCPARDALCKNCGKKGHFQKVCRSRPTPKPTAALSESVLSAVTVAAAPACLQNAISDVIVNGIPLHALVDTGSSESYVSASIVRRYHWHIVPSKSRISMANTNFTSDTLGHCVVTIKLKETVYQDIKLSILPRLCADVLLGHDFLNLHRRLEMSFGGSKPNITVNSLTAAHVIPPALFQELDPTCKPIATKSRRHSPSDEVFIRTEIQKLLSDKIIEPSTSPWRAQVLVTTNERQKRRMVVDYSQTINRFTFLDAYPLPHIDGLVEKISRYDVYSTVDLRSAYHQIPIREAEKKYTAFEACGKLYQFCRIPFGVTNGVACFQRTIDQIIQTEHLEGVFAYIDNVTICGKNEADHDSNYKRFLEAAQRFGLTFNEEKSIIRSRLIKLLGYEIARGIIKPDPDRFQAVRDLIPPANIKAQQRVVGLFSYYSQWISRFSDKIHPLVQNKSFPLSGDVRNAFECLKEELEKAVLVSFDPCQPLVVETDASDVAIAATLNQNGRPVAFFSRTLSSAERHHSAVEKEAHAIVESIRRWRHYLIGNHFKLVTDQRSVAYMYDNHHSSKIKNDKIQRWRIELSPFRYDVVYRPGGENDAADALSRNVCGSLTDTARLRQLHNSLCHPGVTRMMHFVRSKNLPYSTQDVRETIERCTDCAEIKPRYYKPTHGRLIKATQPFERLNIDFKGPLPSVTKNKYLLTIIDEYSRFPFAFACPDMTSATVITCLCQLFALFGMPAYIHSDRGSAFMSQELRDFLHSKHIATSRTTPYNPQGNGQVERLNGTLWKAITLGLKSQHRPVSHWEHALLDALHSIRSLLCTATNTTPHERMFNHQRRSTCGESIPTWLMQPGPVLLKSFNRSSKYDPLVEEVNLLECNPEYAHVRFNDGREQTVSIRQLAPTGEKPQPTVDITTENLVSEETSTTPSSNQNIHPNADTTFGQQTEVDENATFLLQQQQRTRPYMLRNREA